MTQPVKLNVVARKDLPVQARLYTSPYTSCRMAYRDGTLYADKAPLEWNAVDADRASALGYGPSDPWPFPDRIETRTAFNSVTDAMMSQQHQAQARRDKVGLLNTHILPKYGALLTDKAVRVVEAKTNRTTMLDFYEFDALTIGQLVNRIQTRLQ